MAENNFGKGIKITSGFDLSSKLPLDNRSVVNTIEERDEHVTNNRAYEGMKVYVLSEKKEYRYNGTDWEDLINATNEGTGIKEIELSETEPTDENISIWINTVEDMSTDVVPRINDKIITSNTTWSSEKINASIINGGGGSSSGGSGNVDLSAYALKSEVPTKVSQLDNDKNYLTKIPSEYITEQELAQTNSSVQKLNEKYDGLSIRHNELSKEVENLSDNDDAIATLEARYDAISLEYNELSGKVAILEEDSEGLKGQCEELAESVERLENLEENKIVKELKEQYEELSASHNELLERFEILEDDNETLKTRYNNLSIGHNELLERHNTLSTNYNGLTRKYDELLEEVETLGVFATDELMTKYNDLSLKYESLLERIKELEKGSGGDIINIPCTSIFLNKTDISFYSVGETETLVPTVLPADCTDNITWESNKPGIARVNNGLVTALSNGSCIIIATCGDYSASCYVNVNIQAPTVDTYTITNDLMNVTNNNGVSSIKENESYYTILTYPDNYELSLIKILMNNIDITDSVCSKQSGYCTINITNVTGDIVITAKAVVVTPEPTNHNITYTIPEGATIDNKPSTVENNSSFTAIVREQEGYRISSVNVTMGGIDITNDVVSDYNEGGTTPPPEEGTDELTLSQTSIIFTQYSETKILTAYYNGKEISPSSIEWVTSDNSVVFIDDSGTIMALANGDAIISATYLGQTATCNVTVNITSSGGDTGGGTGGTSNSIILEPESMTITVIGQSRSIIATLSDGSTGTFNYSSSNTSVATVNNNGVVTSVGSGSCIITVTCGSYSATCNVTVNITSSGGDSGEVIPPEEPSTGTLTLNKSSVNFTTQNETLTLITYYNGVQVSGSSVNWNSSKESIVYVDSNGTIMAMANGTAIISANYNGLIATCNVTVNITSSGGDSGGNSGTSNGIILEPKSMIITAIGQSRSIIATLSNGSSGVFNYTSSNNSVATVNNNGVVTSVGSGSCIITVTCGSYSATCNVTVETDIPCTGVYLSQPTLSFEQIGQSKNLVGTYEPENCTQMPSWQSSDYNVATVNANGRVTSKGSGNCIITFTCGSHSATCTVTVSGSTSEGGNSGNSGTSELIYTNPTIVMEGIKAKATQNGVSQYFDVSHVPNTGHSKYVTNKVLTDSTGKKYYLALLSEGSSPFGNGTNHYDSGGWYSHVDQFGNAYESCNMPYAIYNNTMNYTIDNRNISPIVVNKALEHFNQTVPDINVTLDGNSVNYIHRVSLNDSFYAVCRLRGSYFYIELNETTMVPEYGDTVSTSTYNTRDNSWVAIMNHELGHTLGLADHATHQPTIYDYAMDETSCTFIQPNDIAYLKYMWKNEFKVDLRTYQDLGASSQSLEEMTDSIQAMSISEEMTDSIQAMSISEEMKKEYKPTDCFSYGNIHNIEDKSDVILNAQLKYNRTEEIDISNGNESIFEYHIYDIIPNNIEKGELINNELKVLTSQNIEIKDNCQYKLYLKQFNNVPCSLINPYTGINEVIK